MEPRVALVQWDDITDVQGDSAWLTRDEAVAAAALPTSSAKSIGWVLRNDRDWLVIAATYMQGSGDDDSIFSSIHKIPRGCVSSIRWMK